MSTSLLENGTFIVQGCPVADGQGPCHGCGGGWPGTLATSEALTTAALLGRLKPERLGCGPLAEGATQALQVLQQRGVVFEAVETTSGLLVPVAD
jgi:hypothetical protein